jgi:membrane fusion protein, copper/silver efflux system
MPPPAAAPAPPRRPRPALVLLAAALAGAALAGGALALAHRLGASDDRGPPSTMGSPTAPAHPAAGPARYACPMHPHVTSDHPGSCPICGMQLVRTGDAAP